MIGKLGSGLSEMPNKFVVALIIASCICVSGFSQTVTIEQSEIDEFIDRFFWYQKYLPLENVPVYYVMRNTFNFLKVNDQEEFIRLGNDMSGQIREFKNIVFDRLRREMEQRDFKMVVLYRENSLMADVQELHSQYLFFKLDIVLGSYPKDDVCLDRIDELYSLYVTRLSYYNPNRQDIYVVRQGDYFRKIALNLFGNEMQWRRIYNFGNNKNLLPNPNNPNLIIPGTVFQIPPPL